MSSAGGIGGGAASGAAMGTAIMPGWGTLIGAGIGAVAGGMQGGAAKKAKKANEARYRQMLALLAAQGQATKDDIRAGAVQERAGQVQTAAGRGLYNTSVLDTLQSQSNDREARALAAVDQGVARDQVQVMGDRVDAYPDMSGANNTLGTIGAALPGILAGFGGGGGAGANTGKAAGQAAENAVGGVVTQSVKAQPMAERLGLGVPNTYATAIGTAAKPLAKMAGSAWGQWSAMGGKRRSPYKNLAANL